MRTIGLLTTYITELQQCDNLSDRDYLFLSSIPILIKESKKYISILKIKNDLEDIENSLVEFCYKCIDSFNENKGTKFTTYLTIRLRDFNIDFISKYYGIKTSKYQLKNYKSKYNTNLKFYFETIEEL